MPVCTHILMHTHTRLHIRSVGKHDDDARRRNTRPSETTQPSPTTHMYEHVQRPSGEYVQDKLMLVRMYTCMHSGPHVHLFVAHNTCVYVYMHVYAYTHAHIHTTPTMQCNIMPTYFKAIQLSPIQVDAMNMCGTWNGVTWSEVGVVWGMGCGVWVEM